MNNKPEFELAEKDYQILKEFEEILHDNQRLLGLLSYKTAKSRIDKFKETVKAKDSYKNYIKETVDKNNFTSPKKEESDKEIKETAKKIANRLDRIFDGLDAYDFLDGIDLEIYFH